ncbi:MAG: hypothetical protein AABY22_01295, partial [Nanoarchaeota archaeon]
MIECKETEDFIKFYEDLIIEMQDEGKSLEEVEQYRKYSKEMTEIPNERYYINKFTHTWLGDTGINLKRGS